MCVIPYNERDAEAFVNLKILLSEYLDEQLEDEQIAEANATQLKSDCAALQNFEEAFNMMKRMNLELHVAMHKLFEAFFFEEAPFDLNGIIDWV